MPAYGPPRAYAQPVLRILDARTGEPVPAAPARRGLTRIEARASGLDPTALRVLLTADLLVRALELGGTPVWTILTAPHRHAELRAAATTLSIRPFEDGHDLASGLGEAQAIHVTAEPADACGEGPVVWVAPVEWTEEPPSDWGAGWASAGDTDADADTDAGGTDAGTDASAGAGGSSGVAMEPGVAGAAERAPGPASGPTPESASEAAPGRMPGAASGPAPGRMTEPASESAPGRMSEPSPEPDTASEPDTESAPGRRSGPASRPAHGRGSEPASQPGPGRTPEPAAGPAFEPAPGLASESAVHAALPFLLADPAALRLALLSMPRTAPVRLDSAVLDEAARRLARWRRAVAGWARQPSRPVPDEVRARLRSAWEDDLDLPAVLEVLQAVASAPDLPDGARFETYVYADRLLALDLARDLGSLA